MTTTSNKRWAELVSAQSFRVLDDVSPALAEIEKELLQGSEAPSDIYGALVHEAAYSRSHANILVSTRALYETYHLAATILGQLANRYRSIPTHIEAIDTENESTRIFWGRGTAEEIHKRLGPPACGIYLIPSHLEASELKSIGLPELPEVFRRAPLVIHRRLPSELREHLKEIILERAPPPLTGLDAKLQENTRQWREDFIKEHKPFTAAEVAHESGSSARNLSASASRWAKEGKIFSVRHGSQVLYPRFQFQHGQPVDVVAKVIKIFPPQASGWEIAFFFSTENGYVGCRPMDLLAKDPERVLSLAQAFVHPADAF